MSERGWTTDAQGQRVMRGMTADETAEYQSLLNVSAGVSCEEMRARFRFLLRQHQTALDVFTAEAQTEPDRGPGGTPASGSNPPIAEDAT